MTDMWGMFLGAKSFNQDLSTWDISSVRDMTSMFSGATSFHQDLCAWGSNEDRKFPYDNAEGIFFNTNCTYQENPVMEQGGPFCGSTCGAVIVTTTSTTDAPTDIATTTSSEATTTTTSIPETTTSSSQEAEVSSPTPIPTYSPTVSEHPTALPSIATKIPTYAPTLSEHPTAFPSMEPTDVQPTSTSTTSTVVPETTTSTSIATTSEATTAVSSTISARDEETTTTSTLEATTEATEVVSTSTAANAMTSPATVSTTESTPDTSEGGTETSPLRPLRVTLTYDISNECGLDAEKVMNEVDNTLKEGLIAATTTVLQQTLQNEEAAAITPKFDGTQRFRMIPPGFRGSIVTPQRYKMNLPDRRRALAAYSDEYPVTIDRILDVEESCEPGTNCLLIISSINVLLDDNDDPDVVKNDITSSILGSFDDGRFSDAVPADTVVCPMEEMSDIMIRAEEDESP